MNLDDLARDPSRVSELAAEERQSLIRKLASLILMLECAEQPAPTYVEAMTVQQVAALFQQSADWVYQRKDTKFASARLRNVGKSVRFDRAQIEKLYREGTGT